MTLVNRILFVAWRNQATGLIHPVGRLLDRNEEFRFEFAYVAGVEEAAMQGFAPLPEFPRFDGVYLSRDLFPLFQNRVMSKTREDYGEWLARMGLEEHAAAPVTILSRSGGRRTTDHFEVFGLPGFDSEQQTFVYRFFARGVRHVAHAEAEIALLRPGSELKWRRDEGNQFDGLAIVLEGPTTRQIGWVPHVLVEDLHALLARQSRLGIHVVRVNVDPAPVSQRLLCRLDAGYARGFVPFSGPRYRLLSDKSTKVEITTAELVG